MSAETGAPLGFFLENRYLTDLRTGAAGAIAIKHLSAPTSKKIAFLGAGKIASDVAKATALVRPGYVAVAYSRGGASKFCEAMHRDLGLSFTACASAQEACAEADVIVTTTPGTEQCLQKAWLKPHVTIVALGSDQPTKNELPPEVLAASKYVPDLTKQCARLGELRTAMAAGVMTEEDVHAELGEVVNGSKMGRVGEEMIVCDLTGTGAQDAAIGQVAWDKLSTLAALS